MVGNLLFIRLDTFQYFFPRVPRFPNCFCRPITHLPNFRRAFWVRDRTRCLGKRPLPILPIGDGPIDPVKDAAIAEGIIRILTRLRRNARTEAEYPTVG